MQSIKEIRRKQFLVFAIGVVTLLTASSYIFMFSSRQVKYVFENELKEYISEPEHGLTKKSIVGDVEITVTYKPSDLVKLQELKTQKKQERNELKSSLENKLYFIVNISKQSQELESYFYQTDLNFEARINQLSFGLEKNFMLISNEKDTIELSHYVYSRMFGSTGASTFMLVFNKSEVKKGTLNLVIKDFDLGFAKEEFQFDLSDINNSPRIKF